jgi:uncharacterized cupredoxin-like copper-binding protein
MPRGRITGALAAVAAAAIALAACGGPAATANVTVTLQEWAIGTSVSSVKTGPVKFTITNDGPADVHEFVVIKTDLSLVALPTDGDGAVDEEAGAMTVEGEVEDVAVGATEELTLTLQPGAYVLICNIYSAEEDEAHYQEGMRTAFTVTP